MEEIKPTTFIDPKIVHQNIVPYIKPKYMEVSIKMSEEDFKQRTKMYDEILSYIAEAKTTYGTLEEVKLRAFDYYIAVWENKHGSSFKPIRDKYDC